MITIIRFNWRRATAVALALFLPALGWAQATASGTSAAVEEDDELIVLSPFEVSDEQTTGYSAATTLAGNRLNTELRDIGNAVSVITSQFLTDTGATNNETLLQYTTNTEVGSAYGNFAGTGDGAFLDESDQFTNPSQTTRVRGLAAADNTRNYFISDIPWDSYNVDRVDLQRGPNSIMFGHGSPAGIINTTTKGAAFRDSGEVDLRVDGYGTIRGSVDFNQEIIDDELAVRVAALYDHQKYKQEPAFAKSERLYGAMRWEPKVLRKNDMRTIFKANFEGGSSTSNRPRTLPPIDRLTPWFRTGTYEGLDRNGNPRSFPNLDRQTFNQHKVNNDNTGRPDEGQTRPAINGGPKAGQPNPGYNPWIGAFGQSFGGPLAYVSSPGAMPEYRVAETRESRGIGPDGEIDTSLGFDFNRPVGIAQQSAWAKAAGLPFAEIYKNRNLDDSTVFDFYNNLIDGPNKEEWSDFDTFNLSLAQTFMNDRLGVEVTYFKESYNDGRLSLITDHRQAIYIDMMKVHGDGTHAGTGTHPDNVPFDDGTPNPNLGRPFITDSGQFGNNSYDSERESARATVFYTHDFTEKGNQGMLSRILGRHTFTGLSASDEHETDNRSWQRYGILDQSYRDFLGGTALTDKFNSNVFAVNPVIYLGPSLIDRSEASGAYIPRATAKVEIPSSINVIAFDSTWANPPGVDPAADWLNLAYLPPEVEYPDYDPLDPEAADKWPDRRLSTQSENPANYVGWRTVPVAVTSSEAAPGNRDLLTTSARLARQEVTSQALVWQGHFLDNSIVGTVGYRKDTAKSWGTSRDVNGSPGNGQVDLGPTFRLPDEASNEIDVDSTAYSVVGHLNDLPGLSSAMREFPVNVSVFYNNSSNFQPLANRVDAYGEPISPPEGETTDWGLLFQTKDGKYSLKINRYETTVTNASSSSLSNSWFIGASQAWSGNWVNRFDLNWTGDTIANAVPEADFDPTNTQYNYGLDVGETLEDAQAREAAAIGAWRTWQASVDPRFYEAWGIDLNDPNNSISSSTPQGFNLTEDTVSKGWEVELSAQPTRNWRLTVNASKTDATRTNIGGTNLAEFINAYDDVMKNTPAGDLRIWWGGAGNETALFQWNQNVGFEWTSRKLQEGSAVPELRTWRFNAISNYDFTEGRLAGLSVGGGVRYQSPVTIGYPPVGSSEDFSVDLSNPIKGPAETNVDFWIGYGRRLSEKLEWRVQLNLRNAFQGNELIPISTQPDGSVAGYRIAPPRVWTLSNTFKF